MKAHPHSLVARVTEFLRGRSKASLSEIEAAFPRSTKKQVHAALCNARDRRQVKVIMRGYRGTDSVWAEEVEHPPRSPKEVRKPKPVASVWELGSPMHREWPPRFDGGRAFQLLGDWNAEEAAV